MISEDQLIDIITEQVIREIRNMEAGPAYADVSEVVIGVGPAFMSPINRTINGLAHEAVLSELKAGIEEEGLSCRVVKIYKTSDVAFIGKEAANMSGSGVGIGIQSKGTAIIHRRELYPLSNLELFPQAPLMELGHYRSIGRNAAKYVKAQPVTPISVINDPMIRSSYQVKAALMHIRETECIDKAKPATEIK